MAKQTSPLLDLPNPAIASKSKREREGEKNRYSLLPPACPHRLRLPLLLGKVSRGSET